MGVFIERSPILYKIRIAGALLIFGKDAETQGACFVASNRTGIRLNYKAWLVTTCGFVRETRSREYGARAQKDEQNHSTD
ncbi:MAG: hypothetical protein C4527_24695 [Candidatus Omnitrophota bacterium]|nr:MAG: hypothetical protein C4527_24695 [Candidatus Omnitrophota bacterium]